MRDLWSPRGPPLGPGLPEYSWNICRPCDPRGDPLSDDESKAVVGSTRSFVASGLTGCPSESLPQILGQADVLGLHGIGDQTSELRSAREVGFYRVPTRVICRQNSRLSHTKTIVPVSREGC